MAEETQTGTTPVQVQSATPEPAPQEQAQQSSPPERPSWLPEKFNSPEQLAEAYSQLEKKLGSSAKTDAIEDGKAPPVGQPSKTVPTPEETLAVSRAGLDADAIANEFLTSGKVSEETYKKAEKFGLDKKFVDAFAAGQAAVVQQQAAALYAEVGGPDEFAKIANWARGKLTPNEIKAFNDATQAGSLEVAKLALRGLAAKYQAAVGRNPNLVGGEAAGSSTGFKSQSEVVQAMRDPRYSKDPAYRAEVEEKLRSGIFNVKVVG